MKKQGKKVYDQVTLVPKNGKGNVVGNRTRADALVDNGDGTYTMIETKLSSKTKLTKGQKAAYEHVKANPGTAEFEVRGTKLGKKNNGKPIKITKYERRNKYE